MQKNLLLKSVSWGVLGLCFMGVSIASAQEELIVVEEETIVTETAPVVKPVKKAKKSTEKAAVKSKDGKAVGAAATGAAMKAGEADGMKKSIPSTNGKNIKARHQFDKERHSLAEPESLEKMYANFKKGLQDTIGLSYTFDVSVLGQRGAPNGKGTAWQTQYYGSANWDLFSSSKIGAGSLQAAYTYVHYWGQSAETIGNRIGVVNAINDYDNNSYYFDQLTYTHQMPGVLSPLSVTIGQFPMYTWDGSAYDANQQINFMNYALSQNGTSSYPSASLGGYVTLAPNDDWTFVVGMQDANNISGSQIQTSTFHRKQFTSFASVAYTPTIEGLGVGQYSVMVYNQPWTIEQPETTNGWSFNISQQVSDKVTLFGRVNGVTGNVEGIKQSYVLGGVVNNPLNRNAFDQIGFATAVNKLNREVNGPGTRSVETVLEGYWAWGVSNFMTLTPDIQFYINPGLNEKSNTATVVSMRATLMF